MNGQITPLSVPLSDVYGDSRDHGLDTSVRYLIGGVRPPDYGLPATPRPLPPAKVGPSPGMLFEEPRPAPALCECPTQFPPPVPGKVVSDMVAAINARTSDAWKDMISAILKKYLEGVVQGTILWRLVLERKTAEREALIRAGQIIQTPPATPIPVPFVARTVIAVLEATPLQDGMSQQAAEQAVLSALPSDLRSRWVGGGVEIPNIPSEISRVFDLADSIMRSNDILVGVRIVSQPPRMSLPAPAPSPVPSIANCPDCTPWLPA